MLQKFRGELQMLDARGQGEGGQVGNYSGGGEQPVVRISASPAPMRASTAVAAVAAPAAVAAVRRANWTTKFRSELNAFKLI